jgi:GDPmannose 4,6-dehydratase
MRLGVLTGVTGQDGSYLAELLLEKGYTVWGLVRTTSNSRYERIQHLLQNPNFQLKKADLQDTYSIQHIFDCIPHESFERIEIYNLGAQSHVRHSFDMPEYTAEVDAIGVLRILECIRRATFKEKVRFYQASTSELYGNRMLKAGLNILNESSGFEPCSPYSVSKLFAYWSVRNYREGYGIFACNGILFNHESPRRGVEFVTRKITLAVGRVSRGEQSCLELGNLDAMRDWGHAKDYVEGMWRMLQADTPRDWVLATGENHSVREFVMESFAQIGLTITWRGEGVHEVGVDQNGIERIKINPEFFRPNELHTLLGDPTRSIQELGWEPKYTFKELVREMVENDKNN